MKDPENEYLVNYLVVMNKAGRRFSSADDNRWGGLLLPADTENPGKTDKGLKVALFASWKFGYILLETLKRFEDIYPGRLNLVGLVTDNPLNPDARISRKKRVWNALEIPIQVVHETGMIESGLSHGIPVYTGEVKIQSFYSLLREWNPDAILVCVFGQIIDPVIADYPPCGIYNFHPSDLAHHLGGGPAPINDLRERNADTTVWTVHFVSQELDAGHIVGQSPPIYIKNRSGMLPEDQFVIWDKVSEALSPLGYCMIEELCRHVESNRPGPVYTIDFEKLMPDEVKKKLILPITADSADDLLPEPGGQIFTSI